MKGFMKGCAITALVLIIAGFGLAIAAGSISGKEKISQLVEEVGGGMLHIDFDWFDKVNYEIEDSMIFEENYPIKSSNVEKQLISASEAENLSIEAGGCTVLVKHSEDSFMYVEAGGIKKLQTYKEGGTVFVKASAVQNMPGKASDGKVILYVPYGYQFNTVDIELGAGKMKIKELLADDINMEVGAGTVEIERLSANKAEISIGAGEIKTGEARVGMLDAEVNMGRLAYVGEILQDAVIECGLGSVMLQVDGRWMDFNYDVECSMGNIELGSEKYSGLSAQRQIDNQAEKKMQVECGMGSVNIEFTR